MKKVDTTVPPQGNINKYKALASIGQSFHVLVSVVAEYVFSSRANQHEKLQIIYANLRV